MLYPINLSSFYRFFQRNYYRYKPPSGWGKICHPNLIVLHFERPHPVAVHRFLNFHPCFFMSWPATIAGNYLNSLGIIIFFRDHNDSVLPLFLTFQPQRQTRCCSHGIKSFHLTVWYRILWGRCCYFYENRRLVVAIQISAFRQVVYFDPLGNRF